MRLPIAQSCWPCYFAMPGCKQERGAVSDDVVMHFYFAYGSNMSAAVLAKRLQREVATFRRRRAVLADHKLVFDKMSSTNPAVGYANVVTAPDHCVEGILNEFDE